jgi:hypothetical protein
MALLKKILNKSETESLFPQQIKATHVTASVSESVISSEVVAKLLMMDSEFIARIHESVTGSILKILRDQYDFTPTDKYLEEVSNRKKYIGQLDSYLQERKEINTAVENELQMFLQETTSSLGKALEVFTLSIQNRIKQAENRHSIDSSKESLLSVIKNEESIK